MDGRVYRILPLLIGLLTATAGCTSLAVGLGLRMRLQDVPVTGLSAQFVRHRTGDTLTALGPGESADLIVTATDSGGRRYVTVGAGQGKVTFDSFTIEPTVASVSGSGRISMPTDPRLTEGGARQGSCRVGHEISDCLWTLIPVCDAMASRSGFSATGPAGVQFRV